MTERHQGSQASTAPNSLSACPTHLPDFPVPPDLPDSVSFSRVNRNTLPVLVAELELDYSVDQGEQRVIVCPPDVAARVKLGAALAHQNVAGTDLFAAVALHSEILGIAGPAVPAGAYPFLVCHESSAQLDVGDADLGVALPMSGFPAIVLPPLKLEYVDLGLLPFS